MTTSQFWITFAIFGLGTMFTRFVTFMVFPPESQPPKAIVYLGSVLPTAAISLIIVYSLKDISLIQYPYGLPELIGVATVVILQKWRRNSILSIILGTIIYMLMVQVVFI